MNDFRSAWRALRSAPMISAAAVLSLALGMGANTAIFSVVDALLLRPLPVREPDRLVTVSSGFALGHGFKAGAGINYDIWTRMRDRAVMFEDGFAWAPVRVDLSTGGEMQAADALFTSGGFFTTLGVPALIGRTFTAADDRPGGGADGPVAVISHEMWEHRFSSAGDIVGRPLLVDGTTCTIVGVMPQSFFGIEVGQPFEVVLPLAAEPAIRGPRASLQRPSSLMLSAMFRLAPGQSVAAATAALRALQPDILGLAGSSAPRRVPAMLKDPYVLVAAASGTSDRSGLRRTYGRPLLTLVVVVALVLLVACVNIANLLMMRAAERRHEMSVRRALGGSHWRLVRQMLTESLLLAALGGAIGLLFAKWASQALVASLSTSEVRVSLNLSLDGTVLAITAGTTVFTTLLFGVGPALRAAGAAPVDVLKQYGRRAGGSSRGAGVFVVLQVALSLVLLVAAALFVSTFRNLVTVPLGFDSGRILVIDVDTARAHGDAATRLDFYQQIVDAAAAVPGAAGAAASFFTPFNRATKAPLFADPTRVVEQVVSPGYFATYGQRLEAGRDFDRRDTAHSARVVVVSTSYARRFLKDREPLSATIETGPCEPRQGTCTVVGVAADAVIGPLRTGARPAIYFPLAQSAGIGVPGRTTVALSLRATTAAPSSLGPPVAEALIRLDSRLSFSSRPLERDIADALTQERLLAALSAFFGGLALLLSALGLYGVTAYAAARRRSEIGVRIALGASPLGIVRLMLQRTLAFTGIGLLAGIAASLWASRFIASLLFGVPPHSTAAIAAAAVILTVVATVASALPATRASLADPAAALRDV